MQLAVVTARRATCLRRQVGAVFLNGRGHVLATGYNGVAAGLSHCNHEHRVENPVLARRKLEHWESDTVAYHPHACPGAGSPSGTNLDACQAIHAEQNALLQCKDVYDIATAYVTVSPCMTCVKLLLNTGCQRICFVEAYPHPEAKTLWESAGRTWEQLKLSVYK